MRPISHCLSRRENEKIFIHESNSAGVCACVCVRKAIISRRVLSDLNPTVTETTVHPRLSSAARRRLVLIRSPCDTPGEGSCSCICCRPSHHQRSHPAFTLMSSFEWHVVPPSRVWGHSVQVLTLSLDPNKQTNCRRRSLMHSADTSLFHDKYPLYKLRG